MLLFSKITRHRLCAALLAAAMVAVPLAVEARPASPAEVKIPLNDARKAGANSVRFSALQLTDAGPVVVLFGATTPSWHKVRAAIQQVVYEGYPFAGVFMGPTSGAARLEIYAQAPHVTREIDLNRITQREIERLLKDVAREYYPGKKG